MLVKISLTDLFSGTTLLGKLPAREGSSSQISSTSSTTSSVISNKPTTPKLVDDGTQSRKKVETNEKKFTILDPVIGRPE